MSVKEDILERVFGYTAFRGQQGAVIEHVLGSNHALVIMPTGMGKSLCFQVPALVQSKKAGEGSQPLTLVISPLIALMKDQVETLVSKGIDAAFINSSLKREEREARYAAVGWRRVCPALRNTRTVSEARVLRSAGQA